VPHRASTRDEQLARARTYALSGSIRAFRSCLLPDNTIASTSAQKHSWRGVFRLSTQNAERWLRAMARLSPPVLSPLAPVVAAGA